MDEFNRKQGSDSEKGRETALKTYNKQKKETASRFDKECFICNKKGHIQKDCYFRKNNIQRSNEKAQKNDKITKSAVEEFCFCEGNRNSNEWYIDPGASNHMTSNKNFFIHLRCADGNKIFLLQMVKKWYFQELEMDTLNVKSMKNVKMFMSQTFYMYANYEVIYYQ